MYTGAGPTYRCETVVLGYIPTRPYDPSMARGPTREQFLPTRDALTFVRDLFLILLRVVSAHS